MLPLEKAFATPRSSLIPPELPLLGSAAEDQEEDPKTVLGRDLEFSRQHFRNFIYQEGAGPHQAVTELFELCRQWLQPEVHSKEQMLELLVLEQFLSVLPDNVRPLVVAQCPESCKKAASLVKDLTKALEEPGGPARASEDLEPSETQASPDNSCPSLDPVLLEQGNIGDKKTEEAKPAKVEPKKLTFPEVPLYLGEWGHLDPAEENLKTFRKLLLWVCQESPALQGFERLWRMSQDRGKDWGCPGQPVRAEVHRWLFLVCFRWLFLVCVFFFFKSHPGFQLAQPDDACRLETEELRLVETEPPEGSFSGGRRWQEGRENMCETLMERITREILVCPLTGAAPEEEEQLQKTLDPQEGEPSPVTMAHRRSVIREPAQDRGTARESPAVPMMPATTRQGLGRKRPCPKDVGGQGPECVSRVSSHLPCHVREPGAAGHSAGSLARPDQDGSPAGCPAAEEPGLSRGKPYACSECGETFAWISHFIDHLRSHSGRKLYACPGCWKTFHFSLALAEHQKTHEKEKFYALGRALGPHPAACGAHASGRLSGRMGFVAGDVFPVHSEAQR
ncbi:zinc finger and SCAN domain-containing protein 18 isoform X2 [Enhydra lutris kenyoni]|uniref:Zinc finger and SCAN domain-containing protein 18 isoform X2 n=1 Tax=Enhydra lutris kenyoni TaxID=391180 RepID=A0A2Y9IH88_ENHLU|nr:zinc finger and SCAN domain-containing protein 18 isoform X2 [Enhydra lutris kenyoni]